MSRFERKCKCKANMEYVGGMGGDGRFWCPECGTYSQSYVCEPTVWKRPRNLPKAEASDAVLGDGWRDARKELPDVIGRYLVYVKHEKHRNIMVYGFHPGDYDNSGWIHNARIMNNVIAWRPLPDQPAFA